MRNNAKLTKLLEDHDLNLSKEGNEIHLMVIGRFTQTNFMVQGTSITTLLNQAIKISKQVDRKNKTIE